MPQARPPFEPLAAQVSGHGDLIVCLHSSTGSSAQWRGLTQTLAERWQLLGPDLHGHGRSPAWPADAGDTLHTDAAAVSARAGPGRMHLVGHSYGAAVALQMALRHPQLVASLTLYEPVLFGMLRRDAGCSEELGEIEDAAASV
jgi:pimeloyl-ACP methyl ester carboxylesterase